MSKVELITKDAVAIIPAEAGYGSPISILPILALVPQLEPFKTAAANIEDQSTRIVIDSEAAYQKGSEFMSICTMNWDQLEDLRKAVKGPVDDYGKFIQALFVPLQTRFKAAKEIAETRMLAFTKAEKKRRDDAEALVRKANEEAALKLAAEAEAKGDVAQAESIMEVAVMAPAPRPAVRYGGSNSFGRSTNLVKRWTATVENPMETLKAIIDGKLPISILEWKQAELNKCATKVGVVSKTLGLNIYQTESLQQR